MHPAPLQVRRLTLESPRVRLEPLHERHLPGLAEAIEDGQLWQLGVTNIPRPEQLPDFLAAAEAACAAGRELAFATLDRHSGRVVGSTRFRNIEAAHRRVEIGSTFIARSWQRTHVNSEAKLLMLAHAFEHWQVNRVELLTDRLNQASRDAIARLGAREEGLLRSHMLMRDGRIRDSLIFSIVAAEWPAVRAGLQARLRD